LEQQKQIEALNAGLQKVSDRVEVSKTAPQVVNSSRGRLLRSGWLTITNKRLVFVGGSEDRTIPLNKVVFVNSNVTGIVLSVEHRQRGDRFGSSQLPDCIAYYSALLSGE
jgi:hypothetical protein